MERKLLKLKKAFCCIIIVLTGGFVYGQSEYNVTQCCHQYSKGYFDFGIQNNADSTIKCSFKNIGERLECNILAHYDISKDTLICKLLPFEDITARLHSSVPMDFFIDGERYSQRRISAKGTLKLSIRIKRKYFWPLTYLKVILPDGTALISKIKS